MFGPPCITSLTYSPTRPHWVNSALHPSGVAKSSTSFGWGKSGNVTSARWQVTLCDPIWHVSSRGGDGRLACKLLYPSLPFFTILTLCDCSSCANFTLYTVHGKALLFLQPSRQQKTSYIDTQTDSFRQYTISAGQPFYYMAFACCTEVCIMSECTRSK